MRVWESRDTGVLCRFAVRNVQPASSGKVVSLSKVGGLHHRYERLAA